MTKRGGRGLYPFAGPSVTDALRAHGGAMTGAQLWLAVGGPSAGELMTLCTSLVKLRDAKLVAWDGTTNTAPRATIHLREL